MKIGMESRSSLARLQPSPRLLLPATPYVPGDAASYGADCRASPSVTSRNGRDPRARSRADGCTAYRSLLTRRHISAARHDRCGQDH